ncbi:N-acetylglutamate synthase, CG3035 family [Rhodococcus chondri]|uniref:GNAT family N-acetyltransferase n=1 Tax=Rhodococcus chondri TaxID=3065941 RepID=A0ABU7JLU0_9NOCA|nr:GNAT family N-acetyltransferase [Rhodococcus sp. CC-R104]MEE2031013.1 GNAT family N-acetyltransferase [Rhodococcus sp. CC-R104]
MTTDEPATGAVPLGSRVVLRYRLPAGYSHPMTDVIGELVALEPAVVVRTESKQLVQVAPSSVVALKALGVRPIRTSEIRALEHAAAAGWPGLEQDWVDGWLVRAGAGFTGRANSATPLGERGTVADPADPAVAARLRGWFAARGLPLRLLLPDRLARVPHGWTVGDEVLVMAADLENVPLPDGGTPVLVEPVADDQWLSMYRGGDVPAARAVLGSVADGTLGFGRIGAPGQPPLAIGRAAVTDSPDGRRWVGLTAVEVAPEHRRHGLGTLLCGALLRWARDRGATHAYLQVHADNSAARALYRDLGFLDHHRYRYATEPVGPVS